MLLKRNFFGKDDLVIPENKEQLIDETKKLIKDYENQYSEGLITRANTIKL